MTSKIVIAAVQQQLAIATSRRDDQAKREAAARQSWQYHRDELLVFEHQVAELAEWLEGMKAAPPGLDPDKTEDADTPLSAGGPGDAEVNF